MYHASRGGVRGGTDQFSWDSVKTDKHREHYLGHSVMAPVGRWQKGKDLSWYSKGRKAENGEIQEKIRRMAAIKKAEEDAMLVALGFRPAQKEEPCLAKEDVDEVLKRNLGERDGSNTDRIEGVGIESGRAAMLMNENKQRGGVMFETCPRSTKNSAEVNDKDILMSAKSSTSKPCKKHKKEKHKKKRKHKKRSYYSSEEDDMDIKRQKKKRKKNHTHHH